MRTQDGKEQYACHESFACYNVTKQPQDGCEADVSLNNLLCVERFAEVIHYPRCWDTAAYPTLASAVWEALSWAGCSECNRHPKT